MKKLLILPLLLLASCAPESYISAGDYTTARVFSKPHNQQKGTLSSEDTACLKAWLRENLSLFSLSVATFVPSRRTQVDDVVICLSLNKELFIINTPSAQYVKKVEAADENILRLLRFPD